MRRKENKLLQKQRPLSSILKVSLIEEFITTGATLKNQENFNTTVFSSQPSFGKERKETLFVPLIEDFNCCSYSFAANLIYSKINIFLKDTNKRYEVLSFLLYAFKNILVLFFVAFIFKYAIKIWCWRCLYPVKIFDLKSSHSDYLLQKKRAYKIKIKEKNKAASIPCCAEHVYLLVSLVLRNTI